jgi:hypothetical protein
MFTRPTKVKMLPQSYQSCFQHQLSATQYITLKLLILLLQFQKQVRIERLAALWPEPILFESRRRRLQRFLSLPIINIKSLWFPIIKNLVKIYFNKSQRLLVTIDRTQWRETNLFVVSLIWDKRALPLDWQVLSKQGCSNLTEQKNLLRPVISLLKGYKIVILGDREFGNVRLAHWLNGKHVAFCLRLKQGRYIQQEEQEYRRLDSLGLVPGISFYLEDVKFTKQTGFGKFDVACKWKGKYRQKASKEAWYILTNLASLSTAIRAYKARSGIEAMFKDCKTGGYNLEGSHASNHRLISLILIIAIAYSCAILQGRQIKSKGVQSYVCRLKESHRQERRHSTFWVGTYGELWLDIFFQCSKEVSQLMSLKPNKRLNFYRGLKAASLIQSCF